ncbi:unnamed protein product [Moneuplotes crassus]|uniref:GB1/RHD3-type G domain-containing protein n=1 Tax=Euplotes crassus TaxID=5936 RepID=A0AAD1Y9X6_EUPCR|nr:unnamed protein product [Moneuplotes crassus]
MEDSLIGYKFREEALPFVVHNPETQAFEISNEAKELFKNISGPFGIVSVAGMYRTGKSYLLNKVLLDLDKGDRGFGVGPSINPCTKGLWIWGTPVSGFSPDGKPINILIIDSEGIGALDEDSNHDTRIFSLCILLSSFFLYNSMGSIDESALQNLNLVINLTKHIHIKSNVNQEEIDSDEYSEYFPSFMWIVRDFTLQLLNEELEEINSNQYLEKALEEQSGFSDKIEEKNRIRRLLKSFFKERQCFTMIRPVTDEEMLQNLDSMDEEQFRPDFVEQVFQLRRKVINCVKPKTLNGKQLSPEMFLTLAESYVVAINQGAVPNIENAWTYICQNESRKSMEKALSRFDEWMNDELIHRFPVEESELQERYFEVRAECKEIFTKSSVGGVIDCDYLELKEELDNKFKRIRVENENQCRDQCCEYCESYYSEIDRRIREDEIQDFDQFRKEMDDFGETFFHEAPPGPARYEVLLEFTRAKIIEVIEYFISKFRRELEFNNQLSQEKVNSLQSQIDDLKKRLAQQQNDYEAQVKNLNMEKANSLVQIATAKESIEMERKLHEQSVQDLRAKFKREKEAADQKITQLTEKMATSKKAEAESKNKLMREESEYSKQLSLLQQELEFHKKDLQDRKKKEEGLNQKLSLQREQYQDETKKQKLNGDAEISRLNQELEDHKERITELEVIHEKERLEHQNAIEDLSQRLAETSSASHCTSEEFAQMEANLDLMREEKRKSIEQLQLAHESETEELRGELAEATDKRKEAEQRLLDDKIAHEKQIEILQQKVNLKDESIRDLTAEIDESKRIINSINASIGDNSEDDSTVSQLQIEISQLQSDLENQRSEFDRRIKKLKDDHESEVSDIASSRRASETQWTLEKSDFENTISELQAQIEELGQELDQYRSSPSKEPSESGFGDEFESQGDQEIHKLQATIKALKADHLAALGREKEVSKQLIEDLKQSFNEEKSALEARIHEIKQKFDEEVKDIQKENEETVQRKDAEIEELEYSKISELEQCEAYFEEKINEYKNRETELGTRIKGLEQQLSDKNLFLEKNSVDQKSNFDRLLEDAQKEKREIAEKYESIQNEKMQLNMELSQANEKVSKIENIYKAKLAEAEEELEQLKAERTELEAALKELEEGKNLVESERERIKFEFDKKCSLLEQELKFAKKNLAEEREKSASEIAALKSENSQANSGSLKDLEAKLETVKEEKERLREKYNSKNSELKEVKEDLNSKNSELERDAALLGEKLKNAENRAEEAAKEYERRIEAAESQNTNEASALKVDNEALRDEVGSLKSKMETIENENHELISKYDKDTSLLMNELEHYKSNLTSSKIEMKEDRERFQSAINTLTNKLEEKKNKKILEQNGVLKSLEEKHNNYVKDLNKQFSTQIEEYKANIKELKEANIALRDEMMGDKMTIKNLAKNLEAETTKLRDKEARLTSDKEQTVHQLKTRIQELIEKNTEHENELEEQIKELSNREQKLNFALNKMNSQYNMEMDKLKQEISNKAIKYDRLKSTHEKVVKDLQKVKDSKKNIRRNYNVERSTANFAKYKPSYAGTSAKRGQSSTGSSMNGSQKENTYIGSKFIGDSHQFGLNMTNDLTNLQTSKSSVPLNKIPTKISTPVSQVKTHEDEDEE